MAEVTSVLVYDIGHTLSGFVQLKELQCCNIHSYIYAEVGHDILNILFINC
jgi:hypothetical protein